MAFGVAVRSLCLQQSGSVHILCSMVLFIVLHKVLFGVTVLSVWLKQSGSVHILCNMVLFIVLHKVPTVSEESNKTENNGHCWWSRIIRNVNCHLPIDTAQYIRSFESLSAQIWKPQIPHNASCVFFKVGTESLNIIQIDFLLQRVKQFYERVQKCFEGLKMRPFGKKSAARQ